MKNNNIKMTKLKFETNESGELSDILLIMNTKIGSHDYTLYLDYDNVYKSVLIYDDESDIKNSSRAEQIRLYLELKDNKIIVKKTLQVIHDIMHTSDCEYEIKSYRSLKQTIRAQYFRNFNTFFSAMLLREYSDDIKVFFDLVKKYMLSNR